MRHKLFIILLIIFFLQLLFRIYQYKDNYLTPFNSQYWKERYLKSQWVVPNSKESIGDDGLYAYSGWEYIHGSDPSLLNAEVPPLGKYLIGFSEIIFYNQNIFALLSGLLVLSALYILNKIIFKDNFLALIPVMLLSADTLFYNQLKAPYLDCLYLGLLILIFIFILKEKFILANIFIGLMMATKASAPTFILVAVVITCYLSYMKDRPLIKKFCFYLYVSILIFLLTYTRYFFLNHNIIDFIRLQKWVLNFYDSGAKGIPGAVWQMLISGKWSTWWGTVQQVTEWNILWPLSLIASIYYFYKVLPKRRIYKSILLGFWIIAYLLFLSFVPVWPRYLLMILPFMYTLLVWVLSKDIARLLRRYN